MSAWRAAYSSALPGLHPPDVPEALHAAAPPRPRSTACPPADERYIASTSSTVATPIVRRRAVRRPPEHDVHEVVGGRGLRVAARGRGTASSVRSVGVAHRRAAAVHVEQHVAAAAEEAVLEDLGWPR